MTRSRAAVFDGQPGVLELREFPTPEPLAGEVVVRVLGCTLCGSDLHSVEGRRSVPIPTVLGHEIVGEIIALDDDAPRVDMAGDALHAGDRVTWAIVANCGDCFYCQRGLPQKCLNAVKYGHESLRPGRELLGGLAEHCLLVPGTAIVRLPEDLPLEVACPVSCATATVAAAIESLGELRDRTVLVLGAGMLGLTACAMAQIRGATVIAADIDADRRLRALDFGASHAANLNALIELVAQLTNGFGVDAAMECSGAPSAFESALPRVRLGGKFVLIGSVFPSAPVPLALEEIVRRNITLHGIHNYQPAHLQTAVTFLSDHHAQFPFADLVSEWLPLSEAPAAFAHARESHCVRIGVHP
jgi:alcohol dehydrogenase